MIVILLLLLITPYSHCTPLNTFSAVSPVPFTPLGRDGSAAALLSDDLLAVFGGLAGTTTPYRGSTLCAGDPDATPGTPVISNETLFFRLRKQQWTRLGSTSNATAPPALWLGSSVALPAASPLFDLLVFGGITCGQRLSGAFWRLSFRGDAQFHWTNLDSALLPPPRNTAAFFRVLDQHALLFWGMGSSTTQPVYPLPLLDDYWLWNSTSSSWTELELEAGTTPLAPLLSSGIVALNDTTLVVCTGTRADGSFVPDVYYLQLIGEHPRVRFTFLARVALPPFSYSAAIYVPPTNSLFTMAQPTITYAAASETLFDTAALYLNTYAVNLSDFSVHSQSTVNNLNSRTNPAMVYSSQLNSAILFGGLFVGGLGSGVLTADVELFSFDTHLWSPLRVVAGPATFSGASFATLPALHDIVVYGGDGQIAGASEAEMWRLTQEGSASGEPVWFNVPLINAPPEGRTSSSMTLVGPDNGDGSMTLLLFGGYFQRARLTPPQFSLFVNSLFRVTLQPDFATYELVAPQSTVIPSPRAFMSIVTIPSSDPACVLLHGGQYALNYSESIVNIESIARFLYNDTWLYCDTTLEWTLLTMSGPRVSEYLMVAPSATEAVLFGGSEPVVERNSDGPYHQLRTTNALWHFDLNTRVWRNITSLSRGPLPGPRMSGVVALAGQRMLIAGGVASAMPTFLALPHLYSDLWSLFLPTYQWTQLKAVSDGAQTGFQSVIFGSWLANASSTLFIQCQSNPHLAVSVSPGCSAGQFSSSFLDHACQLCPHGTYANTTGATECVSCPALTSTPREGAVSVIECTVCVDDACSGHGHCAVLATSFTVECTCNALYFSSDRCRTPWGAVILASVGVAVILLGAVVCFQRRSRRFEHLKEHAEFLKEHTELLLHDRNEQVEALESTWRISYADLASLERLSAGAFGEVFAGVWCGRPVAVKFLQEAVCESDHLSLDEFQREITFLRSIRHAHIVFFYGAGTVPATAVPFLVTELLSEGSLRALLSDQTKTVLSTAQRRAFAMHIADAMCHLHSLDLLHRDLKCDNVFVTRVHASAASPTVAVPLVAKVGDFGCSTLVGGIRASVTAGLRQTKQSSGGGDATQMVLTRRVGTLLWQAPELLRGERDYTFPVDVYSFGVILWELVTRRVPYEGMFETVWSLEEFVLAGGRPSDVDCPVPLRRLMEQCWCDMARERLTFKEIVEALRLPWDHESDHVVL